MGYQTNTISFCIFVQALNDDNSSVDGSAGDAEERFDDSNQSDEDEVN
jgi:hypothetical protein